MSVKDILLHLRLPFSLFLMPIYWLGLSFQTSYSVGKNCLIFIVLHFLVYPASNAYNSYCDKDTGPIGGLEKPPKVTPILAQVAYTLDFAALFISYLFISKTMAMFVLAYIVMSRLYSWPITRLKKYPFLSFGIVGVFQGALVYFMSYTFGQYNVVLSSLPFLQMAFCACLLWSVYPITQIYQHQADKLAGDKTMSQILGINGTFINAIFWFLMANIIAYFIFSTTQLLCFVVCTLPTAFYLLWWFWNVQHKPEWVNFKHTMRLNAISSLGLNVCFIVFNLI